MPIENSEGRRRSDPGLLLALLQSLVGDRRMLLLVPEEEMQSPVSAGEVARKAPDSIRVAPVSTAALCGQEEGAIARLVATYCETEIVAVLPAFGWSRRPPGIRDPETACFHTVLEQVEPAIPVLFVGSGPFAAGRNGKGLVEMPIRRAIRTVVEFERQILFDWVHRGLKFVALELEEGAETTAFLRFDGDHVAGVGAVVSDLHEGKPVPKGFCIPSRDWDIASGLLPRRHDPAVKARIEDAERLGTLVALGEVYEISTPPRQSGRSKQKLGRPVLAVVEKSFRGGAIDFDFCHEVEEDSCIEVENGDVLVRELNGYTGSVIAAVIPKVEAPVFVAGRVLILKPRDRENASIGQFISSFMRSSRFADQLPSVVAGRNVLSRGELQSALVPVPSKENLDAVASVSLAAQRFEAWTRECSEVLDFSFEAEDLEAARAQLVTQSRILRQRSDEASKLDDLDHRVLTRYPLPVAYRWRTALAAIGSPEELRSVVHAQEVLFAYLSVVVYAAGAANSCEVAQARDVARRLGQPQRGLGLGDWRAFLQGAAEARTFRKLPSTSPFVEVRDVLKTQESIDAANYLADVRNDLSHLREFGPGEISVKLSESWRNLRLLAAAAAFISEYDLVRVTGTSWDAFRSVNTVEFRRLMGDSPVVPVEQGVVESSEIESGSLYLADGKGQLHLLRPILIGDECKHCGHWSTFMPDRGLPGGLVEYKSLEHGHSLSGTPEMTSALTSVGWWSDGSS